MKTVLMEKINLAVSLFEKFLEKWKVFLFVIPFAIFVIFGFTHLIEFQTADEHLWFSDPIEGRIQDYWKAIESHDWVRTRINDKPGITLALVSWPMFRQNFDPNSLLFDKGKFLRLYNPEATKELHFIFRTPVLLANILCLILAFFLLWKLFDDGWPALIAISLVATFPILIGISQIVNPDSLLWSAAFVSILAYLVFLKSQNLLWAALAGLFLGLAFLSKYAAILLVPFFYVSIFIFLLFKWEELEEAGRFRRSVILIFSGFLLVIAIGLGAFMLGMPAAIVIPKFLYSGTIGFKGARAIVDLLYVAGGIYLLVLLEAIFFKSKGFLWLLRKISRPIRFTMPRLIYISLFGMCALAIYNWTIGHNAFNIPDVPFDASRDKIFRKKDFLIQLFLEFRTLVFSLTPLALFALLGTWIKSIIRRSHFEWIIASLSVFLLAFYYAVLKQELLAHIRYSVLIYPVIMVIGSIGIYETVRLLWKSPIAQLFVVFLVAGIHLTSIYFISPFYFNYTNDLLPKNLSIAGAWGYGGYEAAQFLNNLPDGKKLKIWSDYGGVCPFLYGPCMEGSIVKWYKSGTFEGIDYVVKTRRGTMVSESIWNHLGESQSLSEEPVWKLVIGERPENYIEIYKVNHLALPYGKSSEKETGDTAETAE